MADFVYITGPEGREIRVDELGRLLVNADASTSGFVFGYGEKGYALAVDGAGRMLVNVSGLSLTEFIDFQDSVKAKDITYPPSGALNGDRYIVGSGASGVWSGWDESITELEHGVWIEYAPNEGWMTWVENENILYVYADGSWVPYTSGVSNAYIKSQNLISDSSGIYDIGSTSVPFRTIHVQSGFFTTIYTDGATVATYNQLVTASGVLRLDITDLQAVSGALQYVYGDGSANFGLGLNNFDSLAGGNSNIAIGLDVCNAVTNGDGNIGIGREALLLITGSDDNIAIGTESLSQTTSAGGVVAIGYQAGYSASGVGNVFLGQEAGEYINGNSVIAIGYRALHNPLGKLVDHNIAIGHHALRTPFIDTSKNVAIGYRTMDSAAGDESVAIGVYALRDATENGNVAVGGYAMETAIGIKNVAVGHEALMDSGSGNSRVAIGKAAGTGTQIGDNCVLLGADSNFTGAGFTNTSALGYGAQASGSNTMRLGDQATEVQCERIRATQEMIAQSFTGVTYTSTNYLNQGQSIESGLSRFDQIISSVATSGDVTTAELLATSGHLQSQITTLCDCSGKFYRKDLDLIPEIGATYDIGDPSTRFATIFAESGNFVNGLQIGSGTVRIDSNKFIVPSGDFINGFQARDGMFHVNESGIKIGQMTILPNRSIWGYDLPGSPPYKNEGTIFQISDHANIGLGLCALQNIEEPGGHSNVAIGSYAGWKLKSGSRNTIIGSWAGQESETSEQNVIIGRSTGYACSGQWNTLIGDSAGSNLPTGSQLNTFVGNGAGINLSHKIHVQNIGIGLYAGGGTFGASQLSDTSDNILIGNYANVASGNRNIVIGCDLNFSATANGFGSCVAIGDGVTITNGSINTTALGYQASTSGSNTIRLGNQEAEVQCERFIAQQTVIAASGEFRNGLHGNNWYINQNGSASFGGAPVVRRYQTIIDDAAFWSTSGALYYTDVIHNLGQKYVAAQYYDDADESIGVEKHKFIDANTLRIFAATSGYLGVIVMG